MAVIEASDRSGTHTQARECLRLNKNRIQYRAQAIGTFSEELLSILSTISQDVWVSWIPSSKTPTDPDYDDRLEKVVSSACKELPHLHTVEILYTKKSRKPLHYGAIRDHSNLAKHMHGEMLI